MADNFQLTANITSVEFLPRSHVRIDGMCWSKHRGGLSVGDTTNKYNKRWFWDSSLPEPVKDVLTRQAEAATDNLTKRKALVTFWPSGLLEEDPHYPFNLKIESFTIFNSDWDKDRLAEARFRITSEHHLGPDHDTPNIIFSTVKFDPGWQIADEVFEVLEEYM